MATYSRYKSFIGDDGSVKEVPFIRIPNRSSDKYAYWNRTSSRMDLISYQYYGNPNYGWLILQANPTLPSLEFMIGEGERVRVPFPLDLAIAQYENDIKSYYQFEGRDG
jgi:hypothetical protein